MSKAFWPAARVSIILLPSGEQGSALFGFAKSWVEAGLLGPAIWVLPESVSIQEGAPPTVKATVLGISPDRTVIEIEVDLFEQLAREALRVIRLVKLRSARPSKEFDQQQDAIVRLVEKYLGWSVPSADRRLSDRDSVLDYQPINLICAPTEFKVTVRENWQRMGYGTSIVAAPEDRTSPWSADAFVRDDAKFDGFTLMHLATVSGIWNGLPVGTLELFDRERSGMNQVWLSRVFFSGVFTDGLARRVAAGFVEDMADPTYELLDPPEGTAFIDPEFEEAYLDVMVEASFFLDDGALEYKRPELPGDPVKSRLGILLQIKHFLVFVLRRFSRIPHWIFMWTKRQVAGLLQRRLQGDDGSKEVGIGLEEQTDLYDSTVIDNYKLVLAERDRAKEAIRIPTKLAQVRSSHTFWKQLRELIFASLDGGSDLSWAGFQPIDGDRRPIFASVSAIAPSGEQAWSPVEKLPPNFPAAASKSGEVAETTLRDLLVEFISEVDKRRELAATKADENLEALAELEAAIEIQHASLAANQGFKLDANGDEAPINLTEANSIFKTLKDDQGEDAFDLPQAIREYKRLLKSAKEARENIDGVRREVESLTSELEIQNANLRSLEEWLLENGKTYANKLSQAMNARLTSVRDDLEQMKNSLDELELPEAGRLISLRKKFHRALLIATSVFASAGILYQAIYSQLEIAVQQDLLHPGQVWFMVSATWLVALLGVSADYYRSWSRFERAVSLNLIDMRRAIEGHRQAQSEENRLAILYVQVHEWLEVIIHALRKPWCIRDSWKKSSLRALDLEKLPFAMRVAQAQADEEAPAYVLRNASANALAKRGWRSKAFDMLVAEVAKISGKTSAFKAESLDRDLPHAPTGARRTLQEFMDDEKVLERVAARQLKPIIDILQGEAMTTARPRVLQVDLDPLSPIRVDPESVVEYEPEEDWDKFLLHTLTLGDGTPDPLTPLTALSLGDAHVQSGEHEGVIGHVLLPQRVAKELDIKDIKNLVFSPHKEPTPAPIDSVVRVDLVGPLNPEITRLLSAENSPGTALNGEEIPQDTEFRPGAFD